MANSNRGGHRTGAGRPKTKIAKGTKDTGFAERVLKRIGELKLADIKNAEDYALQLLATADNRIRKEVFHDLLNRVYGRAPIGVEHTGEIDHTGEVKVTVEFLGVDA